MFPICELFKIRYPLIQGGMGNISHAALTAAVSNAGGLGTLGCGTLSVEEVASRIQETRTLTEQPFALNIAIRVSPCTEALIDLALAEKVPVVSLSAGNPAPYIERLQAAGIKTIAVVASVKQALKAEQAGADVLVAEGFEAAGINSPLELTTLTLIPQLVDRVKIPVLAAGGIGDGRGLAAVLLLGAAGVQLGTRLIATEDAKVHTAYKSRLTDATDTDTRIIGRSVGFVRRVLDGPYVEQLTAETPSAFLDQTNESYHIKGALEGNEEKGYVNAGLVAGLIRDVPTVAELFTRMMAEAEEQLKRTTARFAT